MSLTQTLQKVRPSRNYIINTSCEKSGLESSMRYPNALDLMPASASIGGSRSITQRSGGAYTQFFPNSPNWQIILDRETAGSAAKRVLSILGPLPASSERVPVRRVRGVSRMARKEQQALAVCRRLLEDRRSSACANEVCCAFRRTNWDDACAAFRAHGPRLNCIDRDRRDMMEVRCKAARATAI